VTASGTAGRALRYAKGSARGLLLHHAVGHYQTVHHGLEGIAARFSYIMTACNLARLPKLLDA
jgi:hypothetical protein